MSTTSTGIWRPPQWSSGPAMVSITQVPSAYGATTGNTVGSLDANGDYTLATTATTTTTYVFDAVLDLDHEQRLEKTRHPVQTGADISSHAYLMPSRVSMYIGMSDAMDAYSTGAQTSAGGNVVSPASVAPFTGSSSSKSVNAYQTLLSLQEARQPLTVTTRLRTYTNMLIVSVSPHEDSRTITGLRARVEFEQIIMASVATEDISARPSDTGATGLGQVDPTAVSTATQTQFQVPQDSTDNAVSTVSVPGAGVYSSVPGQLVLP